MSQDEDPVALFAAQKEARIRAYQADADLGRLAHRFREEAIRRDYEYNFTWMGRPIIQLPQDILAMQEIIWSVEPDLIIETGVAHGGSVVFSASMLALLGGDREVVGIDVEIRPHNRAALEAHPMKRLIHLIEGSSTAPEVIAEVKARAAHRKRVLVALDSNHTHAHVAAELEAYAPLVSTGSYLVVFDTVVEDLPAALSAQRPWKPGDSPKTAVHAFLASHPEFAIDRALEAKLLLTVAPDGYLKRLG